MAARLPALCIKLSHLGSLSRISCGDCRLIAKESIAPYGCAYKYGKFSLVDKIQSSTNRCRKWFSTVGESLEPVNGKAGPGPVIAVGLSGGVDSSIAALLLKRQGYRVFGVYMRNWDSSDEVGGTSCPAEQDYEDARRVAKHLGIELYEVDNQKRYWTDVFESFTSDFSTGLTPNPDLACNRYIKFDALLEQAKQLGADKLATGHYARLGLSRDGQQFQLLRGIDHDKDQSYFLASVAGSALQSVIFPLGSLIKSDVRMLAATEGLITAQKRSSAGICFVGRRNFSDFISEYVDMKPGPFIAVNSGAEIGTHDGIPSYTHGQRARIGGKPEAWYVVGKDVPNNSVFVAAGPEHPALFCTTAVAGNLTVPSGHLQSSYSSASAPAIIAHRTALHLSISRSFFWSYYAYGSLCKLLATSSTLCVNIIFE